MNMFLKIKGQTCYMWALIEFGLKNRTFINSCCARDKSNHFAPIMKFAQAHKIYNYAKFEPIWAKFIFYPMLSQFGHASTSIKIQKYDFSKCPSKQIVVHYFKACTLQIIGKIYWTPKMPKTPAKSSVEYSKKSRLFKISKYFGVRFEGGNRQIPSIYDILHPHKDFE